MYLKTQIIFSILKSKGKKICPRRGHIFKKSLKRDMKRACASPGEAQVPKLL